MESERAMWRHRSETSSTVKGYVKSTFTTDYFVNAPHNACTDGETRLNSSILVLNLRTAQLKLKTGLFQRQVTGLPFITSIRDIMLLYNEH